ncbi:unnamed protein product [Cyprideis torosa]|uniref:Uncharacterized protein n=1 Tax=Cyprideis torosa TaxID=163714 RepID=A0A7R8WL52_9CRUS|nr:unnamed protein product [Cyprideis torosa]CAG0897809.1 unnamed protein product [Cyprideis torosa]
MTGGGSDETVQLLSVEPDVEFLLSNEDDDSIDGSTVEPSLGEFEQLENALRKHKEEIRGEILQHSVFLRTCPDLGFVSPSSGCWPIEEIVKIKNPPPIIGGVYQRTPLLPVIPKPQVHFSSSPEGDPVREGRGRGSCVQPPTVSPASSSSAEGTPTLLRQALEHGSPLKLNNSMAAPTGRVLYEDDCIRIESTSAPLDDSLSSKDSEEEVICLDSPPSNGNAGKRKNDRSLPITGQNKRQSVERANQGSEPSVSSTNPVLPLMERTNQLSAAGGRGVIQRSSRTSDVPIKSAIMTIPIPTNPRVLGPKLNLIGQSQAPPTRFITIPVFRTLPFTAVVTSSVQATPPAPGRSERQRKEEVEVVDLTEEEEKEEKRETSREEERTEVTSTTGENATRTRKSPTATEVSSTTVSPPQRRDGEGDPCKKP